MKLITEQNFNNIECLVEETEQGKRMYIEGIFIQANKKNRNGRIYEDKILRPVVSKYIKEQVKTGRAGGELNHPQSPVLNPERICHRITELKWDENDVYGKALVLDTPMGNIVKGLIEGGFKLGVSSRGMGSLEKRGDAQYVKDDFSLATVDCVSDPSAPDAFVNGILEGVEFIYDSSGRLIQSEAEQFEESATTLIHQESRKTIQIDESKQLKLLKQFLKNL